MKTININGKEFTIEELNKLIEDSEKSIYPIYCQLLNTSKVVKFTDQTKGVLVKNSSNDKGAERVGQSSNNYQPHDNKMFWRPIPVCQKTGFFHGQLVWAWDNCHTHYRALVFYNVKNQTSFKTSGDSTSSLVWDNYLPFEGNWPDWALEAYKTLEL